MKIHYYHPFIVLSLFLLYLLNHIHARLTVFSPSELRDKFPPPKHDIDYVLASFGDIPRGKTLMGLLYYADPNDGCSSLNRSIISEKNENDPAYIPIVMVERGNCTFTTKAKFAQLMGAKMLIVIDNKNENVSKFILGDDGHGESISIPTIMIGKSAGTIFKDYLKNNPDSAGSITLIATFPYNKTNSTVNTQFWFSSADKNAYPFLASFGEWVNEFGKSLIFTPHYILLHSVYGRIKNWTEPVGGCYSAGRFCVPDPDGQGPASGETVLLEDLRQLCIMNRLGMEYWFHYVEEFGNNCMNWTDENCSDKIMDEMKWNSPAKHKISRCIDESFVKSPGSLVADKYVDNNKILQAEVDAYTESGVPYWPVLIINHSPYKGSLSPSNTEDIVIEICKLLSEQPEFCQVLQNERLAAFEKIDDKMHYFIVFLILLAVVIILVIMLYVYKRIVRREISREMTLQINEIVSKYVALNEGGHIGQAKDNL